jgi:hypothetical protein
LTARPTQFLRECVTPVRGQFLKFGLQLSDGAIKSGLIFRPLTTLICSNGSQLAHFHK